MIWVGTSGYNYPEWKGKFYPADLPAAKMLPYYAARFRTVEINYTFYRVPTEKTLAGWAAVTPEGFKLTLKAPRRLTHDSKLRHCGDLTRTFCATAATLGDKLGVLLFQLPPRVRAAFEFRHESWLDEGVYARLKARNLALCVAQTERMSTPVVLTADYGYFRLRDEGYTSHDIKRWAQTIREQSALETFVYFKHEEAGKGPEFAKALMEELGPDLA